MKQSEIIPHFVFHLDHVDNFAVCYLLKQKLRLSGNMQI